MAFALMFPNLGDMSSPFGLAKQKIGRVWIRACIESYLTPLKIAPFVPATNLWRVS